MQHRSPSGHSDFPAMLCYASLTSKSTACEKSEIRNHNISKSFKIHEFLGHDHHDIAMNNVKSCKTYKNMRFLGSNPPFLSRWQNPTVRSSTAKDGGRPDPRSARCLHLPRPWRKTGRFLAKDMDKYGNIWKYIKRS